MIIVILTQNQQAVVDDEFAELAQYKWCATWNEAMQSYYAQCSKMTLAYRAYKHTFLYRAVMSLHLGRPLLRSEFVDHINHDTLDNRLENLKIKTSRGNQLNSGRPCHNTSGYKGVTWHKRDQKWRAYIKVSGKNVHLGYFINIIDAAQAYDQAYLRYGGEDAVAFGMNFPENFK